MMTRTARCTAAPGKASGAFEAIVVFMQPLDLWLVGFGLRCGALLAGELATFLFVVPMLFNLHSDAADAAAAVLALAALAGGFLWGAALTR